MTTLAATLARFSASIRAAGAADRPLQIRAGGTKDFYGQSIEGEVLDPRDYAGIVDYDPSELVITARTGTRLAELEQAMREQGQMLACEPPHFGTAATVGGAVAAGLSGPRRSSAGSLRDFILGVRVMDGHGNPLTFGGQVMKNVAGYDVSRVMAGSLGTLGLLLEVSLKTLPLPVAEATLRFEIPEDRALERLQQWAGKPLPISAVVWQGGELAIRLSGARAAVDAARTKLGGEWLESVATAQFWLGVREQTVPFFATPLAIWRVSVPSSAPPLAIPGDQLIEWGGALRWCVTDADARTIRSRAAALGGHATLFRQGDKSVGVFTPLTPAIAGIHRDLKAVFDPHGIFNRSRLYTDF
ncbi:MAG: glycolate oxidase subunit GlcE [Betaproteobacteria bacterium]|nr:glycolate oxidase subunit GlcE [Betaproteobacteria bacterium]